MEQETELDLTGIDPRFHQVVREHGRALWVLVFNANMAREALGVVAAVAQKHASKGLAHAGGVLGQVLAEQGNAYCQVAGWTQEAIDACAKDTLAAMQEARVQLLQ